MINTYTIPIVLVSFFFGKKTNKRKGCFLAYFNSFNAGDSAEDMLLGKNQGFRDRWALFLDGRQVQALVYPNLYIAEQKRYLPPNTKVVITLKEASDDFRVCVGKGDNKNPKLVIDDIVLGARYYILPPKISAWLKDASDTSRAEYNFMHFSTFGPEEIVGQGAVGQTLTLFRADVPHVVLVWFVNVSAYAG